MKQTIRRTIKPKLFISFSSYKSYKNCPEMYRQNYLIPKDTQDDEFVAFDSYEASVGSAVQAVFEHLINKQIDTSSRDRLFKRIDDDILYLSDLIVPLHRYTFSNRKVYIEDNKIITKFEQFAVDTSNKSLKQLRRKFASEVATLYRKPLIKMLELYDIKKMSSEVKVQVDFKDFILGGKIDFIHYMDKNHLEILDGKRQYNPLWTDPEQVYIYGIMVEKQFNKKVKKLGYWDWKSNKIHYIDFTHENKIDTLANLIEFKKSLDTSIKTGKFRRKAGFHCRWCCVKDNCDRANTDSTGAGEFETL